MKLSATIIIIMTKYQKKYNFMNDDIKEQKKKEV